MTRHSLYDAFDRVDHEPTAAFRDGLRAQLLDELGASEPAPGAAAGEPGADDDDQRTDGSQNVVVIGDSGLGRRGRPRHRMMVAVAAATIVIVGAGALLLEHTGGPDKVTTVTTPETVPATTTAPTTTVPIPTTTPPETVPEVAPATVPPVDDEALVADALVESNEIGEGVDIAALNMTTLGRPDTWAPFNDAFAAEPACSEHTAAIAPLLADATGAGNVWNSEGSYDLFFSSVTAFADVDAASQAMDAYAAPSFPDCFIAFWDTGIEADDPNRNDVATTFLDEAPIEEHGDRQIQFAVSTTSNGFAPSPTTTRVLYIQYDRLVLSIFVNEDALGPDARFGLTQVSIRAAVGAIEDALGIG